MLSNSTIADPNWNLLWDTYSPLAVAAQYASVKLLKYNARIKGSGALAVASWYGKMDMVKFLLIKRALTDEDCLTCQIDTVEQDAGGTALRLVKRGRVDILKHLLEEGADTTLMDHRGRTPLRKFLEIKDMKLVQALKDIPVAEPKKATLYNFKAGLMQVQQTCPEALLIPQSKRALAIWQEHKYTGKSE